MMAAVRDGVAVAEGAPIPLEYWMAMTDTREDAQALYELARSRSQDRANAIASQYDLPESM